MDNILYETIADIAYTAGVHRYYSGDSRADISLFVFLANKFEKKYEGIDWNDSTLLSQNEMPDYMEAIEAFVHDELKLRDPVDFCPAAATTPWDTIEIEAVHDDGENATPVQHLDSGDYPVSYHSLYLHQVDGGVACIADVPTEKHAEDLKLLIETSVRTFMKTDNSEFVELKPRLLEELAILQRSHYHAEYKKAINDVNEFIKYIKLP